MSCTKSPTGFNTYTKVKMRKMRTILVQQKNDNSLAFLILIRVTSCKFETFSLFLKFIWIFF